MPVVSSVCVYCGSTGRVSERYRAAARRLGELLAAKNMTLVYGGGKVGLMGIIADSVLAGGGQVIGIIPDHIQSLEVGHPDLTELIVVPSMHDRKRKMFERSDAFVVLPGGLGTVDEMVEVITWKQLALHDKPIVLVNDNGYWQPFLAMLDHMIDQNFVRPQNRRLFRVVDTLEDVFPALAMAPEPMIAPQAKWM